MPFQLQEVVPWGRSFEEYRNMFDLSDQDLKGRILGCGDGPASFNAELTKKGGKVVSVDPLLAFLWKKNIPVFPAFPSGLEGPGS